MKTLLKGIAITALILAGLTATAIKMIQDAEITQQIVSDLINN